MKFLTAVKKNDGGQRKIDRGQNWTIVIENAHCVEAQTAITDNGDGHHKMTVVTENDPGHQEVTPVTRK